MLPLLLSACGGGPIDLGEADALAAEAFAARPSPHHAFRISLDHPDRFEHTWGTPVVAERDLRAWLADCPTPPGSVVDARLVIEAGGFPWDTEVDGLDDEADACVASRLAQLPFEEPIHAGAVDVAVLRWTVGAPVGAWGSLRRSGPGSRRPPVVLPPGPAYVTVDGDIPLGSVHVGEGRVRFRVEGDGHRTGDFGSAEVLARRVSCAGEGGVDLTRLVILARGGELRLVATDPEVDCVEAAVHEHADEILALPVGEGPTAPRLGDAPAALVRLDVPLGAW